MSNKRIDGILNEAIESEGNVSNLIQSLDLLSENLQILYNKSSDLDSILSAPNIETSTETPTTSNLNIQSQLTSLLDLVTSINSLKAQVNLLSFNNYEITYMANCVTPLTIALVQLSTISASIMATTQLLNASTTTKRKTAKLKKSEKTVYSILQQINCIYPIIECRLYELINQICASSK